MREVFPLISSMWWRDQWLVHPPISCCQSSVSRSMRRQGDGALARYPDLNSFCLLQIYTSPPDHCVTLCGAERDEARIRLRICAKSSCFLTKHRTQSIIASQSRFVDTSQMFLRLLTNWGNSHVLTHMQQCHRWFPHDLSVNINFLWCFLLWSQTRHDRFLSVRNQRIRLKHV